MLKTNMINVVDMLDKGFVITGKNKNPIRTTDNRQLLSSCSLAIRQFGIVLVVVVRHSVSFINVER